MLRQPMQEGKRWHHDPQRSIADNEQQLTSQTVARRIFNANF